MINMVRKCPKCGSMSLDFDPSSKKYKCVWVDCDYSEPVSEEYMKKTMKLVCDNIIRGEQCAPFIELLLKCPKCQGQLFCNLYPNYIIYVCGTYNCGFSKIFYHKKLLEE